MKVTTTPAAHLAFANLAYCSPSDLSQFAVPGSDLFLTNVADVHTENRYNILIKHRELETDREGEGNQKRPRRRIYQHREAWRNSWYGHLEVWTKSHIGIFSGPCTTTYSRSEEDTVIPKLLCGASGSANKTGKPLLVKEASNLQIIPESCDNFVMITNGDGDEP
ncbi:hypothetical protein DY000_02031999 [Brassica cretica]|uniref:Vesicle-fusing ATPase n=1 Tax=Brassica cretica TaxID=69181 RepID=A0ABQ7DUH7_BRACR|nr:hypothetical protein DY000_02031999 [Brassica cretica]